MQIGGSLGQGLLCSIQTVETRTADPRDPEPSTLHLGPRAFSVSAVVSLGSKKNGIIVLFIEKGNLITLS